MLYGENEIFLNLLLTLLCACDSGEVENAHHFFFICQLLYAMTLGQNFVRTPPPTRKSQFIWVSIEISIWTPLEKLDPLENVGPPLDPLKSIVFSVQTVFWPLGLDPPPLKKILDPRMYLVGTMLLTTLTM